MRAMLILVAGDPVVETQRERGGFPELIIGAAHGSWQGAWRTCDLRSPEPLPTLAELAGVVVTGSASSVMEHAAWIERGALYLRELVSGAVPLLGICFGHQLLGHALGGRVDRNPSGREMGTAALQLTQADPILGDVARVNMTHLDSILELPPGAECLARTALERYAAVHFAEAAWGVQFHPEIDANVLRQYVCARREQLLAEARDVEALERSIQDTPEAAGVLGRFLRFAGAREVARSQPSR